MTLKEYLMDYASPETRALGERLIASQLGDIPREKTRSIVEDRLARIGAGERDFRF
jgi:2-iminoacetate synthase